MKSYFHFNPLAIHCVYFLLIVFNEASPQSINVQRTIVNPVANFDISYIDITGSGKGPTLFQLQITPPQPVTNDRYYVEYTVICSTNMVEGIVYKAETGRFTFEGKYSGGIFLTSNQFLEDRGQGEPSLHNTREKLQDESMQRIFLVAGKVPTGRIHMRFRLLKEGDASFQREAFTYIDVVAISYVKCVSPGADVSASADFIPEVFSPYPQFIWSSDLLPVEYSQGAVKFIVTVYENPENIYSLSDIPESPYLWQGTVKSGESVNYLQYPLTGVKPLRGGKTYYWQVEAVLQGPVERKIRSRLFGFRVSDIRFYKTLTHEQKMIFKYLQIILGPDYQYVTQDLAKMYPEGKVMLNGEEVDIQRLEELVQKFIFGEVSISSVELE